MHRLRKGSYIMKYVSDRIHLCFLSTVVKGIKTRLLPDLKVLKPQQNVTNHSLFKLCKFYEKINDSFFARGQNVLFNA